LGRVQREVPATREPPVPSAPGATTDATRPRGRSGATAPGMSGRLVAELIRKPTRSGNGHYFVGHVAAAGGGWTRLMLVFNECRTNDAGEVVEVFELRAEEALARPSRYEVAPSPARRIGATRDGARPSADSNGRQTAARPEGHPTDRT
jgi:hypothetical protein